MHLRTMRSKIAEWSLGNSDFYLDRLANNIGLVSVPVS